MSKIGWEIGFGTVPKMADANSKLELDNWAVGYIFTDRLRLNLA